MSTLQLDRTDGGVDAMVSEWKVGGEYEIRLKVRQTSATPENASFDVIEATDESTEAEPAEETPTVAKPKASKPSVVIPKY